MAVNTISTSVSTQVYLGKKTYPGGALDVTNTGTINAGASLAAVATGITHAAVATITNAGVIEGEAGIYLADGGSVTNLAGGVIAAQLTGNTLEAGVIPRAIHGAYSITNAGSIFGYEAIWGDGNTFTTVTNLTGGVIYGVELGVQLSDGGLVINQAGATIASEAYVYRTFIDQNGQKQIVTQDGGTAVEAATLINAGTLEGLGFGAGAEAVVTGYGLNSATGLISATAGNGVVLGGFGITAAVTLINDGTIYAANQKQISGERGWGVTQGASGYSTFADNGTIISETGQAAEINNGIIILSPTAVTQGYFAANGFGDGPDPQNHSTLTTTLELASASSAGVVTLGSYFGEAGSKDFNNLSFAPGGQWTVNAPTESSRSTGGDVNPVLRYTSEDSTFGTTITNFGSGDTLDLGGITLGAGGDTSALTPAYYPGNSYSILNFYNGNTTNPTWDGTYALNIELASSISNPDFVFSSDGHGGTDIALAATCYARGTRIRTSRGEVKVEELAIGDLAITASGACKPVKWIGRRSYDERFCAGNHLIPPVRFEAGAITDGVPARALFVSPGHGMFVEGILVPAWRLINGVTITQEKHFRVIEYFHVELDEHDILLAENCPAESFHGEEHRGQFHNAAEFHALYRDAVPGWEVTPRVEDGFALDAIRHHLAGRAGIEKKLPALGALRGFVDLAGPEIVAGWAQDDADPEQAVCLDVLADGRRIARVLANRYRADLRAAGCGSGCHGFEIMLPEGVAGQIEVRRTADATLLALTEAAITRAAA